MHFTLFLKLSVVHDRTFTFHYIFDMFIISPRANTTYGHHLYIYICMYMYTYMYRYVCIYVWSLSYEGRYVCMYVYIYICTRVIH